MEAIRYENSEIDERIIRAVTEIGYEEMTPIQQSAIPALLEGRDIIGQAQTGTGKTAAFGIPLVQMIAPEDERVQAIVLCPTRELAIQAAEELRRYAKYLSGVKVLPVYGGQDIEKQIRSLRGKVSIVVGTPGRVMDHMRRHTLKLEGIRMVVLDEADEMLNMGFVEDIETILAGVPEEHQTALFSATMPDEILRITGRYQKDAQMIQIERKELTIPLVKQYYYEVQRQNKEEVVCRLLDYYNPKRSLIFCNTKHMADVLCENLKGRGYFADALHGDLSQMMRDKVMNSFRNGTTEILIATDVAARGLDVDDVEAVFNFDIPQDVEYYVHRIGRTGRAGRKGRSFTLVVGREIYRIRDIERICNTQIKPRMVPSVADITQAKASQIFDQVMEVIANNDLSALQKKVEDKIEEENITAMELCAGFLKLHLGDDMEEIPAENYIEEMKKKRAERKGGRGGRRGEDDGREGGRRRRRHTDEDVLDVLRRPGRRKSDRRAEGEDAESFEKRAYDKRSQKRDKDSDKRSDKREREFDKRSDKKERDFDKRSDKRERDFDKRSDKKERDFGKRSDRRKSDKKAEYEYERVFDKKSDKKSDKKNDKKSDKKSKGFFGKERTSQKYDIDKKTGKAKKWK